VNAEIYLLAKGMTVEWELQWGRAQMNAEMAFPPIRVSTCKMASMGPRLEERGNNRGSIRASTLTIRFNGAALR
jgi:hypothetical protein